MTSRLADVLERGAEAPAEEIDVVVERLGSLVEALVGHDAGGGEIARELDHQKVARLPLKARFAGDVVEKLAPAEHCGLKGQLEDPFLRRQRVGKQHAPAVAVVAPDQIVHDVRGHDDGP